MPCDLGQYSKNATCYDCPIGYYCSRPDFHPQLCPRGYTSSRKSAKCTGTNVAEKLPVMYQPGRCPIDHDCTDGIIKKCNQNQVSKFGDITCETCPDHLHVNKRRGICEECLAGYECKNGTITLCNPGLYSLQGNRFYRTHRTFVQNLGPKIIFGRASYYITFKN